MQTPAPSGKWRRPSGDGDDEPRVRRDDGSLGVGNGNTGAYTVQLRTRIATMASVLVLALLPGCSTVTAPTDPALTNGVVHHQSFEGGFYSITSDDGRHYDPLNLPAAFQRDGLAVRFSGRVRTDLMSVHMYGEILEITEIAEIVAR
jgi:hypothetical protein